MQVWHQAKDILITFKALIFLKLKSQHLKGPADTWKRSK